MLLKMKSSFRSHPSSPSSLNTEASGSLDQHFTTPVFLRETIRKPSTLFTFCAEGISECVVEPDSDNDDDEEEGFRR